MILESAVPTCWPISAFGMLNLIAPSPAISIHMFGVKFFITSDTGSSRLQPGRTAPTANTTLAPARRREEGATRYATLHILDLGHHVYTSPPLAAALIALRIRVT